MAKRGRYWIARCAYEGHAAFNFFSTSFFVVAEHETVAVDKAQEVVNRAWGRISPHPAPMLVSVIPGILVIDAEMEYQAADERRICG